METRILVGVSFMGMGDPVSLIRPGDRVIVASSICHIAKCLKIVRKEV